MQNRKSKRTLVFNIIFDQLQQTSTVYLKNLFGFLQNKSIYVEFSVGCSQMQSCFIQFVEYFKLFFSVFHLFHVESPSVTQLLIHFLPYISFAHRYTHGHTGPLTDQFPTLTTPVIKIFLNVSGVCYLCSPLKHFWGKYNTFKIKEFWGHAR